MTEFKPARVEPAKFEPKSEPAKVEPNKTPSGDKQRKLKPVDAKEEGDDKIVSIDAFRKKP